MSVNSRWTPGVLILFLLFHSSARGESFILTWSSCLEAAMEQNRELIQAREAIKQVEGSRIFVRSRFHPSVDLTANYDAARTGVDGRTDDQLASSLRFSQRLFEYGPDFVQEVQNRDELRKAIYDYEGTVYEVLSSVWETYQLILLRNRQLATRRESLANFQALYQQQNERYKRQLATENDVLQANLNVLNDSLSINETKRQLFIDKMTLLRLIGRPIGTEVELAEENFAFSIDPDQAVELALTNSVAIALATERCHEQERVVREIAWDYSPDLKLNAGVEDGRRNARIELGKDSQTWGVDVASEYALQEKPAAESRDQTRWFTQLEATIPLFEGGSRIGRELREKARLRQLQVSLRDLHASVELQVSQAYQSVLEAEGRQRIQAERVNIAFRRLEITQILKDKGQADENLLENYRSQFFDTQDRLFSDQTNYIRQIAALRRQMGYFE